MTFNMSSNQTKDLEITTLSFSEKGGKRCDYLEWDEYFMSMTFLQLRRGTSKHFNDAAIILNHRKIIISMANTCTINNDNNKAENYISHAEYKALEKINQGSVMYTTAFPCDKCAEFIAQAGIKEVIFYNNTQDENKAKDLFDKSGVKYRQFTTNKRKIEIDFSQFCDN